MDNESLIWYERPDLVRPYMIMAFEGWANAGQVPSAVSWYLISNLQATLFAELKPDEFYIYQTAGADSKRPLVNIENGIVQSLDIITTHFWYYKDDSGGHDVILMLGPEPEQNWNKFTGLVLDLAQEFNVEKIVTLGGSFDAIPHTVPTRITAVVSDAKLKDEVKEQGIELISYKGPSSIYGLFTVSAAKRNLQMISLWASTPHYIQVLNFIACYHLMVKLTGILDIKVDLEVARKDSENLCLQVDQAIEKKPELQEYFRMLESEYRKGKPDIQEPINKNIIKEIEDLLKGNQS